MGDSSRYLVLDAGTTAGRALVFDGNGRALAEVARDWSYEAPEDCAPWGREFAPARFWAMMADAAREALAAAREGTVVAVAATGQRQATVLVDAEGHELYAGPNLDLRACFEGARLLEENGERIHALTGHLPPMMFASARWLWLQEHKPEVCSQTHHLLMMGDWLTWRLCGLAVTDATNAAETGLFDVTLRTWSPELAAAVGLPPEILPQVLPAGAVAGELGRQAAAALGLCPGIAVVVAGADTACGTIGLGLTRPGQVGVVAGWSAPAQMLLDEPRFDPARALWTTCSHFAHLWVLEGNPGPCGSAYRWLLNLVLPAGTYEQLDELAAGVPPGSNGALALAGPRIADYGNPHLLWGGLLLPQANDLLPIGRAEFARATLENIAYALRANLERVEAVAALRTLQIDLGGGLSRSQLFSQVLADVLGRPVRVSAQPSVSGLGAAMCAAVGVGDCAGLADAATAMKQPGLAYSPRRAVQAEYLDAYERWLQVYRGLETLSVDLV